MVECSLTNKVVVGSSPVAVTLLLQLFVVLYYCVYFFDEGSAGEVPLNKYLKIFSNNSL